MKTAIVAAMAENGVIGKDNQLPWHLPADLQHFKKLTLGCAVIMGRKTFMSLPRPLPDRLNIIVSRNSDYKVEQCPVVTSLAAAIRLAEEKALPAMIIGGGEIFSQALEFVDELYLTLVHAKIAGDITFPLIDYDLWQEVDREDHQADEKNPYAYSFIQYQRKIC